jgi:hypothetical protein
MIEMKATVYAINLAIKSNPRTTVNKNELGTVESKLVPAAGTIYGVQVEHSPREVCVSLT